MTGQVVFSTGPAVPTVFLAALAATASKFWLIATIGLRVPITGESAGIFSLQMSFDGVAWSVIQATLPLPGFFVPLDDGIAEPGSVIGTANVSLVPAGRNWVQLGPLPAGTPRLHVEDFTLHITRAADLLNLGIATTNMVFEVADGAPASLAPVQNGQPSFWRVTFPPQRGRGGFLPRLATAQSGIPG